MRSGAVILGIAVSAVLLAVASGLYVLAGNNSGEGYRKSIDLVRQIQLLSSEWSMEVTRVKSDQFADIDSLAAFIPRMARLKDELSDTAQRIPGLPDRIASDTQAYLNAIEVKEERIDRFKAGYAVVRNANRYLPLTATNILRQAQNSGDDALVRSISGLIRDVNLYLATPTDTSQSRLTAEIKKLYETRVAFPSPLATEIATFLSNAESLVAKQGPMEELFRQVTSDHTSDQSGKVTRNLQFELGKKVLLATYYDWGILAVFVILVLFWILLALQQRITGRAAFVPALPSPSTPRFSVDNARTATKQAEEHHEATETVEETPSVDSPPSHPTQAPGLVDPLPLAASSGVATLNAETTHRVGRLTLLQGFIVKSVADTLGPSAEDISDCMDYLGRTQKRLHDAFRDNNIAATLPDGKDIEEEIDVISSIVMGVRQRMNNIADLAKRLDTFSDAPDNDVERGMIDLNTCIENVSQMAEKKHSVEITKSLGEIPDVLASQAEIEIILSEIIDNSVAAVGSQAKKLGVIKIDTTQKEDEILITVIDNGIGISPSIRNNIFKPFYTSREGTLGIGLTLVGHLVKKYEGTIKINSLPGQGTVARITLPAGVLAP